MTVTGCVMQNHFFDLGPVVTACLVNREVLLRSRETQRVVQNDVLRLDSNRPQAHNSVHVRCWFINRPLCKRPVSVFVLYCFPKLVRPVVLRNNHALKDLFPLFNAHIDNLIVRLYH
jgi:hypothetical protein